MTDKIPCELDFSLFKEKDELIKEIKTFFQAEWIYFHHLSSEMPWENDEEAVMKELWLDWNILKGDIHQSFIEKDKSNIAKKMTVGFAIFLKMLFWTNHLPVKLNNLNEDVAALKCKPMNLEERMFFVSNHIQAFPSYRQLQELIIEQYKQYAKKRAMNK